VKLALVIPSLTAGGAERVMSIMANHWAGQGWDIRLLSFDDGAVPPFFALDPRVRHRPLALLGDSAHALAGAFANLRRLRVLREALRAENPAAVISFLDTTNVLTLLATRGLGIPVIVAEHIDPAHYPLRPAWAALRRWLYPQADRVVVLTERAARYFPRSLGERLRVVPNPVVVPEMPAETSIERPAGRRIVAMGRLVEQKGFDLLLQAFAELSRRHPDWSLVILGEGPSRGSLEALRDRLGLAERVAMPGSVRCPEAILARSDLFVLSSRFEGFPMALCEAMALGLPVVAFDCPTGPREIVTDGVDGRLIPAGDGEALAAAMDRLMADAGERRRLGERARTVGERFGLDRVMSLWEHLLAEVTQTH
jgi:GalNAc-alpha-(1->4)-GalNAc-alpha-(1->3)-diNAcBac-PP-undecaprenol alpha-1,4-N-acetyl-D-galactosaminyltransferase